MATLSVRFEAHYIRFYGSRKQSVAGFSVDILRWMVVLRCCCGAHAIKLDVGIEFFMVNVMIWKAFLVTSN